MATEKGVWDLQDVRDKQLASEWEYTEVFELWSWGNNGGGVLGQNQPTSTNISSPVQVGTDTTWKYVAGSPWARVASKTDGTLWAWGGAQESGGLGLNLSLIHI